MSEFFENLFKGMYQGIWDSANKLFVNMQDIMEAGMQIAHDSVSKTPEQWNQNAYGFIKSVSEDAVIPIAACMISFVFCWQLISMVQESNQMHNIKPENMVVLLVKLGVCLLVCAKSFEIVNGLFDIAKWGVDNLPSIFSADSAPLKELPLPKADDLTNCGFGDVFDIALNYLVTFLAKILMQILSVLIYIQVNVWYMELLIYMSAAPMPFSTFLNKEWGQMGMNYIRKMLAMVFQGFFMLVAFGLYQAIVGNVLNGFANADYLMSMVISVGCGAAMFLVLNKCGSISASVFNAH